MGVVLPWNQLQHGGRVCYRPGCTSAMAQAGHGCPKF